MKKIYQSIERWLGKFRRIRFGSSLFAVAILLVLTFGTTARADYEQALRASVQVYCATEQRGNQQWFNVGSGVFVAKNEQAGFVLTNAHVATGADVTIVFHENGKPKYKAECCRVIGRNNKVDVAVIKVEREKLEDGDPVCIPINPRVSLKRGQKLGTIGFPGGNPSVAYYVQYAGRNEGGLRFRPGVKNGQSGSGLFADWREVVGVVWGSTNVEGVAVPIELVLTTMGEQTIADVRIVGELPYNIARFRKRAPIRRRADISKIPVIEYEQEYEQKQYSYAYPSGNCPTGTCPTAGGNRQLLTGRRNQQEDQRGPDIAPTEKVPFESDEIKTTLPNPETEMEKPMRKDPAPTGIRDPRVDQLETGLSQLAGREGALDRKIDSVIDKIKTEIKAELEPYAAKFGEIDGMIQKVKPLVDSIELDERGNVAALEDLRDKYARLSGIMDAVGNLQLNQEGIANSLEQLKKLKVNEDGEVVVRVEFLPGFGDALSWIWANLSNIILAVAVLVCGGYYAAGSFKAWRAKTVVA